MDLLTQGLLGSSLAISGSARNETRKAALIGLLAGLSADVDFLIGSTSDPLLNLEYHRHFTHSVFFIPIAALLLGLLLWPVFRSSLNWNRVFLYCLLGYSLSGFLDACTSYGTSLLWPLSNERISFNIISIIDPVFTLLVIAGVLLGIFSRIKIFTMLALLVAASYLLLGVWQKQHVQQLSRQLALQKGHEIERLLVKPTLGNLWLWRSVYQYQGRYYISAFHRNPFTGNSAHIPGSSIAVFDPVHDPLALQPDSVMWRDIQRFAKFSNDYLALHPENADIVFDVRYANLPNSALPLWGIRLNRELPDQHADYETYRDTSRETREAFIDMLLNRGSHPI